ncbi:MAG: thioredoxin-disulfide reductase [bacterium]|nr:thioredoxin-disulfide reductase [bacterium]
MNNLYDVIIIGSGPAGYTAAIYTSRANLKTLVLAGEISGGQLVLTDRIENFPGFAKGVTGLKLMDEMKVQAKSFGAEIKSELAKKVDFGTRPFLVSGSKNYRARGVIIATGASAKWLGLKSEEKFIGKGVSSCATCDGFFFKNKEVAVVGGGDAAMEEALMLTRFANKVTVIHRRDKLRASKIMQQRALNNPKIDFIFNSLVTDVLGDDFVNAIEIKNLKTNKLITLPASGMLVAIGHKPNTEIFLGRLKLDEDGYIQTKNDVFTDIAGVFAAGDVSDKRYRQAITAAALGCKAAMEAEKFLEN